MLTDLPEPTGVNLTEVDLSEGYLVEKGAPTLAGLKSGNLFSCAYGSKKSLFREIAAINRVIVKKGLRLIPLRFREGRALLYLYRPAMLGRDLARPEAADLLKEAGYPELSQNKCLAELMRRLRAGGDFPHEIGLFLGYPVEDVRGFIEQGAAGSKYCGLWQVYGDVNRARRLFASYKNCTARWVARFNRGVPLEALTESV